MPFRFGNPVKIGSGPAAVTGDESFRTCHWSNQTGKAKRVKRSGKPEDLPETKYMLNATPEKRVGGIIAQGLKRRPCIGFTGAGTFYFWDNMRSKGVTGTIPYS
jgi:hypothetical protein